MGRDTNRTRLLLVVLLLVAFTLITLDYTTGKAGRGNSARNAVHAVFGPVENGVATVVRPVGHFFSSIGHLGRDRARADRLQQENDDLRRQLSDTAAVKAEATQLAALRLVADTGGYTVVPGRVIAVGDTTGTDWTVTINAGTADGIKVDQLVLNSDGLVGSVVQVSSGQSVVRLACDPASHVGARLERTSLLGAVAGGSGPDTLTFTLYDTSQEISVGDRLVTYGSLDYAAGVPIGTVTKVTGGGSGLTQTATVKPFVRFGALDTVGVIVAKPAKDPGDRVLKPRPVASPTPTPSPSPTPAGSPTPGSTP